MIERTSFRVAGLFLVVLAATLLFGQPGPRAPMKVPQANSASFRWLQKSVTESRLLDDMEDISSWSLQNTYGYGTPTDRPQGKMALSTEQVLKGHHSLRLQTKTKGDRPGPDMGRPFGSIIDSCIKNVLFEAQRKRAVGKKGT